MSSTIILARQAYLEALADHDKYTHSKEAAEMAWRSSKTYRQLTQAPPDPDGIDHLLMLDAPMAFGEFKLAVLEKVARLMADPPADPTLSLLWQLRMMAKLAEMIEQGVKR